MKVAPDHFDEDALAAALERHWGFVPVTLEHVALGFSYHWAATDAAGERRLSPWMISIGGPACTSRIWNEPSIPPWRSATELHWSL